MGQEESKKIHENNKTYINSKGYRSDESSSSGSKLKTLSKNTIPIKKNNSNNRKYKKDNYK